MIISRIGRNLLISMALLMICFTIGCPGSDTPDKSASEVNTAELAPISYGGVYTLPLRYNPTTLDPARLHDWNGYFIANQLFEGLVQFGPHLTVLPALAQTWQVEEEGKVYHFILRQDARFHNDQPVTAADVVFTLQRLLRMEPPTAILPHLLKIDGAPDFRNRKSNHVAGLQIVDANMLKVRLTQPHAPFLTALGMYQAAIVPRKEVIQNETQFGQHPIGCGPFQFVGWEKNRAIRLAKFPGYYAGPAFLENIEFRIYAGGDLEQILTDFKQQQLMEMPAHGHVKAALANEENLHWFHRPSLGVLFYGIRGKTHPLLSNPDFRKALALAIDYAKLSKEIYHGQFEPARSLLPPGLPGFGPRPQPTGNELVQAQEHLNRALQQAPGIDPHVEIVSAIKSPLSTAELMFVKSCWARIGIHTKIKFITQWDAFEQYLRSDAVQIYRYAWLADMPDPDSILYPLLGSDSPVNFAEYCNGEVDRQLAKARSILDPVRRARAYTHIESLAMADAPIIPIAYLSVDRVYHSHVQGMKISALGFQSVPLHRVWLKPSTVNR